MNAAAASSGLPRSIGPERERNPRPGHLGARRVWCGADEANARSWRVAERLGIEHEGTLKSERCDPDGTRRTMRIYAMVR